MNPEIDYNAWIPLVSAVESQERTEERYLVNATKEDEKKKTTKKKPARFELKGYSPVSCISNGGLE